jgi:hypothetical protein
MTAVPLAPPTAPARRARRASKSTSKGKDNGAARSIPAGGNPHSPFPPGPPFPPPGGRCAPKVEVQPARKGALRALTTKNGDPARASHPPTRRRQRWNKVRLGLDAADAAGTIERRGTALQSHRLPTHTANNLSDPVASRVGLAGFNAHFASWLKISSHLSSGRVRGETIEDAQAWAHGVGMA